MFSAKLGHLFDKPLEGFARKIPISPNAITVAGFVVTGLGSYYLINDLRIGGLIILAGAIFDIFDGVVARAQSKTSQFGAFLDSLLDRYSDAFIMIGLAYHYAIQAEFPGLLLSMGTLAGSFLISYARARAEGMGKKCSHGLMERAERIILIVFGAISGLMIPVLWVLLILTNVTVIQRVAHIWKLMRQQS